MSTVNRCKMFVVKMFTFTSMVEAFLEMARIPSMTVGLFSDSINHLQHVVKQISSWMTSNLLCLNPSKTEFILIGFRDQLKKIPNLSISFNLDSASTHTFTPTSPVRNVGVIFYQNLSFSDHITQLSRSCFMHIRDLR